MENNAHYQAEEARAYHKRTIAQYLNRYEIVSQTCLRNETRIKLFNCEELSDHYFSIDEIFKQDDILTSLSANDIRTLMSMWADHILIKERDEINELK